MWLFPDKKWVGLVAGERWAGLYPAAGNHFQRWRKGGL